jgi:ubiquitin carboxyl-terminal hydrolase 8
MGEPEEHRGIIGLANIGNTCYLNSVVQALRNCVELTSFFIQGHQEEFYKNKDQAKPSIAMTRSYVDLIKMMWGGKKPAFVRPDGFFQDMSRAVHNTGFDQFQTRMAHDSHEFLMFLLDSFHESIAEEVNITIQRGPPTNEEEEAVQKALEAWKQQFQKSYSPLIDLLFGLYHREMCCQGCQKKSSSWEMFNCLKVAPPLQPGPDGKPLTIKELLQKEMEEETITDYACDHCKPTRTTAIRKTKLWKLPRCLFIVVKRFTPDGRKVQGPISANHAEDLNFGNFFSEFSPEPSRQVNYRLYATVDHHGSTGGGHYTAQAQSPLNQKWYGYDDDSTHILQQPSIGSSSYILFYRIV